jgi:hypothetical protein
MNGFVPRHGGVAAAVPADRGDLPTAERHVRLAAAGNEDYELMIVTAALAKPTPPPTTMKRC